MLNNRNEKKMNQFRKIIIIIIPILYSCNINNNTQKISSVEISKLSAQKGDTIRVTANYDITSPDVLYIDPDGELGDILPSQFDISPGEGNKYVDAVFGSVGSYTPEAWLDSDSLVHKGDQITISDAVSEYSEITSVSSSTNTAFEGASITVSANYDGNIGNILYIDPDGDGALPSTSFNISSGSGTKSVTVQFNTPSTYTPEAWLDSDGAVVTGDNITIDEVVSEITSVSSSTNNATEGASITVSANYDGNIDNVLHIDPDGDGALPSTSFNISSGSGTKSVTAQFNTPGTYTPEAWLDSDGAVVTGDNITIDEVVLEYSEITSVSSSTNNATEGASITVSANYDGNIDNVLHIDPDGDGALPSTSFNISSGSGTKSVTAQFNTPGTYTPEAWLDSDGASVTGNNITINEIIGEIPTINLRFGSLAGGSDANYNVYAGEYFDIYLDANDDVDVSKILVYDAALEIYRDIFSNSVINFDNEITGTVMDDGSGNKFLRIGGNNTYEKTGTFSIKAKAVDTDNQESSIDEMNITLETAVGDVTIDSTDGGTFTENGYQGYLDLYETQHKADGSNIITLTDVATSDHDTVKWYFDSLLYDTTSKGGIVEIVADFYADKGVSYELYKNGGLIAEGGVMIRGANTAPEHPECDDADDIFSVDKGRTIRYNLHRGDINLDSLTLETDYGSIPSSAFTIDSTTYDDWYIEIDTTDLDSGYYDVRHRVTDGYTYTDWEDITIEVLNP